MVLVHIFVTYATVQKITLFLCFREKRILSGGEDNFEQYSYLEKKIIEHMEFLIFYFLSFKKELFLFSGP